MTGVTNEEVFAELYYSKKAIKELTGVTPRCWRPPYGDVDNRVRYIAEKLDLATIVYVVSALSKACRHSPTDRNPPVQLGRGHR